MISIVYVTSSEHKRRENALFAENCELEDGKRVSEVFSFEIRSVRIRETLEINLEVMVTEEVKAAYRQLRVPCIVEHAGLVFDDYQEHSYPGGLTKPMWDALGDRFSVATQSAGRAATAIAVVAYCDGKSVKTFRGETHGTVADSPRGTVPFYWDTVFMPDQPADVVRGRTYAEIVDDEQLGLIFKVTQLSQSTKAMLKFLEFRRNAGPPDLWPEGD